MAKHVRIRTGLAGLLLSASLVASATPQSPLIAPADPIGYFERLTRARALIAKEDFAGAEPLLEQLAREYPRDRLNWSLLGTSKRRLNKCAEAIPAYQRSIEIVGPYWSAARYWIAACQLKIGRRQDALDTLETHVFEDRTVGRPSLFDDKEFAALKSDPRFVKIAGVQCQT